MYASTQGKILDFSTFLSPEPMYKKQTWTWESRK